MTNAFSFDTKQFDTAQIDSLYFAPARAFAALSVDYTEKLVNAQLEATRAYTDLNLAQLRRLVEVKDAEGLKRYVEGQQDVAKQLTERLKGDAEKVVALQQEFVQESQKLTEGNVKQAQESVKQVQESAEKATASATSKSGKEASAKSGK
ncbi:MULTISPECIES: phasin family protein [unclassified Halomonas]|uniref:phasin family protein n=1 Tax=unclassified Halomonas TaxID=2609666 RepID=UPI002883AE00|nr:MULTISPECIES: phasin family protein [unclassified Halomonas]MDT0500556.1 phasin family protein [Halomonas sp. PAR7]MDT0511548.1 phasin family protein [Halomonas sp. LES1]MDT0590164.1 phasin family protein [Halomonas sp. PAR8]